MRINESIQFFLFAGIIYCVCLVAAATDWPQYGGVGRDGVSTEEDLIEEWPEGGLAEVWTADVGQGGGSCAIVGDKVYVLGALDDPASEERRPPKRDTLICLNKADGAILWTHPLGDYTKKTTYDSPHATPAVVDGKVYSISRKGHLFCNNAEAGALLWDVDTVPMMGGADHDHYGYSCSPLVEDGRVFMFSRYGKEGVPDNDLDKCLAAEDQKTLAEMDPENRGQRFWRVHCAMLAFDAKTGAPLWRTKALKGPVRNDLASPTVGEFHGERLLLWTTGASLAAVRPDTGEIVWCFDYVEGLGLKKVGTSHAAVTPQVSGNLIVDNLWNHEATNQTFVIRVTKEGPELVWQTTNMASWYHPLLVWEGLVIGLDNQGLMKGSGAALPGTRPKDLGMLQCYDIQNGEQLWHTNDFDPTVPEQRLQGMRHSYILVDGKLIIQSPRGGVIFLEVNRERSRLFGSFEQDGRRGGSYPQPALSDGKLFIRRHHGALSCYDAGAK